MGPRGSGEGDSFRIACLGMPSWFGRNDMNCNISEHLLSSFSNRTVPSQLVGFPRTQMTSNLVSMRHKHLTQISFPFSPPPFNFGVRNTQPVRPGGRQIQQSIPQHIDTTFHTSH